MALGRERSSDRVRGLRLFPLLHWELVERQGDIAILGRAIGALLETRGVSVNGCSDRRKYQNKYQ